MEDNEDTEVGKRKGNKDLWKRNVMKKARVQALSLLM